MNFYKELMSALDEGLNSNCFIASSFNICDARDDEEHIHLEWGMSYVNGEVIFDYPDVALEAMELLLTERSRWADFTLIQIFTDRKVNENLPTLNDDSTPNFSNFYRHINKFKFSEKHSDENFIVLSPVPAEILKYSNTFKVNEIPDQPMRTVILKRKKIEKEIKKWNIKPSSLSVNIPIKHEEMKKLQKS